MPQSQGSEKYMVVVFHAVAIDYIQQLHIIYLLTMLIDYYAKKTRIIQSIKATKASKAEKGSQSISLHHD